MRLKNFYTVSVVKARTTEEANHKIQQGEFVPEWGITEKPLTGLQLFKEISKRTVVPKKRRG